MGVRKRRVLPCPLPAPLRPVIALGLEGSANKIGKILCALPCYRHANQSFAGVGLILHSPPSPDSHSSSKTGGDPGSVTILSNIRHTYVTPPGEGFLPSDTARHHKRWINEVVERALKEAGLTMENVDVICYTKGIVSGLEGEGRNGRLTRLHFDFRSRNGSAASNCRHRSENSRFIA
jgi:N6-L-threonylcarbamoyladenine synthase